MVDDLYLEPERFIEIAGIGRIKQSSKDIGLAKGFIVECDDDVAALAFGFFLFVCSHAGVALFAIDAEAGGLQTGVNEFMQFEFVAGIEAVHGLFGAERGLGGEDLRCNGVGEVGGGMHHLRQTIARLALRVKLWHPGCAQRNRATESYVARK